MVLLLNINFYLLGIRLRQKLQLLEHLAIPVALTACSLFIYFFLSDIGNLKQMNQQLDMRIVAIGQAKNSLTSKDTLFLPVLPYTKTLMSNELRGGVYLQWDEEAFKKYYETAFQIKIVPTKQ
jgi:Na+/glutamate symporter